MKYFSISFAVVANVFGNYKKRKVVRKMTKICSILMVLFIAGFMLLARSTYPQTTIRDIYKGVVSKSDGRKAGEEFTFANLHTSRPFVTYPSGIGNETVKVFEDNDLTVLIFVANLTGSTDTFYLSKEKGRFTLIEVSALEARVAETDFRPIVTYGKLK